MFKKAKLTAHALIFFQIYQFASMDSWGNSAYGYKQNG